MIDNIPAQWEAGDYLKSAAEAEFRNVDERAGRLKAKVGRLERSIEALRNWGPLRLLGAGTNAEGDR